MLDCCSNHNYIRFPSHTQKPVNCFILRSRVRLTLSTQVAGDETVAINDAR